MGNVQILDCTLRDGGYCNEWKFGASNIKKIINGLFDAEINIIECGFLNHKTEYDEDVSKFSCMSQLTPFLPKERENKKFVLMGNYGQVDINMLEMRDQSTADGIRVAFHKKDRTAALELCHKIKEKGYDVFVQAMVSLSYTDEEFLKLIQEVNLFKPYAFYIVDSFGVMKQNDLIRLFYLVEHNLDKDIRIGYHSHNNMQLAYSNSQALVNVPTTREIIFDSSVMGMGRGAGNLNTELFVEYLNSTTGTGYKLKPVLTLIDEIINKFHQQNYWGYSLPNYLSAKHNIHPNYARYLSKKNTLTISDMDAIFEQIEPEKRINYDKEYIEDVYLAYMKKESAGENKLLELKNALVGKRVLLIAPGKSAQDEKDKIIDFDARLDAISISVNFDYREIETDYIFVSNIRRFCELGNSLRSKTIITSNIPADHCFARVGYADLINQEEFVSDNAGLMVIKLMIDLGAREIHLAGFDGYSYDNEENYAVDSMKLSYKKNDAEHLNNGIAKVLSDYKKHADIRFLTKEKFVK